MVLLAIVVLIMYLYLGYFYGYISIPTWLRPSPKSTVSVEDYHSSLKFNNPEKSELPRVAVYMDEDYRLSKDDYTSCSVKITNAAEYNLDQKEAKIKIWGNSTAITDKKPYKIKFSQKTSLFGGGREKSWILLTNVNDITGIHNYVSMELYRHFAKDGTFVPVVKSVSLHINDEYQRAYNLCNQVETGKTRVPISGKIRDNPEKNGLFIGI